MTPTRTIEFFLVFNEAGAVRTTVHRPKLKSDEIAVGTTLVFPRNIFTKPQLKAVLTISDDAISHPEMTGEILDNVRLAIEQGTGMGVTLSIAEAPA